MKRESDQGHGTPPRSSYEPLTEERIGEMRTEIKGATTNLWIESSVRNRWHGELDRLCQMAVSALLYAEEIQRLRGDTK